MDRAHLAGADDSRSYLCVAHYVSLVAICADHAAQLENPLCAVHLTHDKANVI